MVLVLHFGYKLRYFTIRNTVLQFKKTSSNINSFCKFIEKKYKTVTMLNGVKCNEDLLVKLKNTGRSSLYIFFFDALPRCANRPFKTVKYRYNYFFQNVMVF